MKHPMLLVAMTCWLSLLSGVLLAADDRIDYLTQVKVVLRERCVACHGAVKQEGGLRLDTAALAIKGGESGAAIEPGSAEASLLMERVRATDEDERMPPEGEPLTAEQIASLRAWIEQNAVAPIDEQPDRDPGDHWAFKTPVRPTLPRVDKPSPEQARWQHNPIDIFISHEHRKHGLVSQLDADKRVWLRRVSIDLIGLPPTIEELDAFIKDESADCYDKVVTRLLESPQYGQRWGRHWMDVWRYSDWWGLGAEVRNSQKHIWHWRDWIIDSLNEDKGYDQMLREMLAADELYPNDADRVRATGFLARQYFIFNRTTWLDQTVEHSAKAMLGLTFNCAKCHDHKYDPLTQVEYYEYRALFEPYQIRSEMVPGQVDFEKDGIPRAFDAHLDVPTYLHIAGDDLNPDKSRVLEPGVPAFLSTNSLKLSIESVELPIEAAYPGMRAYVVETHRNEALRQIANARTAVDVARKKLTEVELAAKELAAKELAAKQLAAKTSDTTPADPEPGAPKPGTPKPSDVATEVILHDDFSVAKPDVWEQLLGSWTHENGKLVQSQTGAIRAALRLKQMPPPDFEATLKYIPTGGDMWKSVGISCDVTADGNELLAYVSAVASGPRAQVAFKQNGNYVYPPVAAQSRKVELNQPHEIVLRVRGTLVNVNVDGEHSIAFRLPNGVARKSGFLELVMYDAKAELVAFELKTLPSNVKLIEPPAPTGPPVAGAATPAMSVEQSRLALAIAEKTLKTAEVQLVSIEARAAADRIRQLPPKVVGEPKATEKETENAPAEGAVVKDSEAKEAGEPDSPTKVLLLGASKSERILAASRAEEALSRAELALLLAAADKKAEAEKVLATAKVTLETSVKAIEVPSETYTALPGAKKTQEDYQNRNAGKPYPTTSTGRRTAFANWLTDPRHPLPARVAVNHIWVRHMGKPLVPTVFDFGRKGTPPTHPELLDWLAVELVEHDWSMKHIHRLIVTSQTYRLSSSSAGVADTTREADPDNRFYWRMNPVRMEAQIIRDSLLSLAGELDVTLGGPSIAIKDETSRRRSLYFVHSHNDQQKFLSTFDDASVLDCYRRAESIVPQQALALENSPFASAMASKIAERIVAARPDVSDSDFIREAFATILSVEATRDEQNALADLLQRLTLLAKTKNRPAPETVARTSVVLTILNHNDFITVR